MNYISNLSMTDIHNFIKTLSSDIHDIKITKHASNPEINQDEYIRVTTSEFGLELTNFQCQILIGGNNLKKEYQDKFLSFMYQKYGEPYLSDYQNAKYAAKIEKTHNRIRELKTQIEYAEHNLKKLQEQSKKEREAIRKQTSQFMKGISHTSSSLEPKNADVLDYAEAYATKPLFEIIEEDGTKYLHFSGYYFEKDDGIWNAVEYPSSFIPVIDFLDARFKMPLNMTEELFVINAPAKLTPISREEVNESLEHLIQNRQPLDFYEITADTPIGEYYATNGKNLRYSVVQEPLASSVPEVIYYIEDAETKCPVCIDGSAKYYLTKQAVENYCHYLNHNYIQELENQQNTKNQSISLQ